MLSVPIEPPVPGFLLSRGRLLRASLLCAAAMVAATPASAWMRGNPKLAQISIVERATGRVLPQYSHEGELWVVGRPGANYAVRIRNFESRRIMGVISVDGVNAINGRTASSRAEGGYVLDAGDSYDVRGWRKSNDNVAAFYFSESDMSYAARTGRPQDVGVIGVALYREKLPEPAAYQGPLHEPQAQASASAAESAAADVAVPQAASKSRSAERRAPQASPTPSLGTGHGAVERSQVTQVDFEADTDQPRQMVRIRYDSYANLVARGVIREPRPRPSQPRAPNPFPGDNGFVPDPPRN
ncbi:UNVERIFIED_CONTAM: hypothetical protein NO986_04870 [Comamonas sp. A-3]|uniref:hypothetical protein n=1 Tax=Comamonas TaxID=283 RepID=UPI0021139256|nr:hypothetical protein [Comamonas thiooxydans]MDH1253641.1 hypothetical protein [Comamonas thiooxydans]UUE95694.1 hypothetical protein MJ608_08675 [Comamonas thiooxydans]